MVDDYRLGVPGATPPVGALLTAGLPDLSAHRMPVAGSGDQETLGRVQVREGRPLDARTLPGRDQGYTFGSTIRLVGHEARLAADGSLEVTLFWQATAQVTRDYTVFLHVLDAAGNRVGQGDGQPVDGWYPTSAWAPGRIIADRHLVAVSSGVARGSLKVAVGLYTLADGQRAPVTDTRGARQPDDQVLLAVLAQPGT